MICSTLRAIASRGKAAQDAYSQPHSHPTQAGSREYRSENGHWEGDLVQYQNHLENLLTMQERKSRLVMIAKNSSKHKEGAHQMIRSRLKPFPKHARKFITFDSGEEYADHQKLHTIQCKTFFCDPYSSWQKSGLEHANGGIRHFLPKNTSLADISHVEIDRIQRLLSIIPS